ncbi:MULTISPECIES: fasciclin domain-containing protein [Nocardioides]|uniref:Fasciclin domain-containing protein n=1 Tax=Nocardioides vastitatis TaxID=2568655 RepID=A0ABW0ZGT7_9ACTN|nr:fasciclin domain-containing protein [Nocardioides sp.]THJ16092.1 fasciclin domain-containing protein [Nocardioides sp.]
MKLQNLRRGAGIATAAVAMSLTLAACGGEGDARESSGASNSGVSSPDESTAAAEGAGSQTFGDGCADVPTDGAGSFDGMVKDPVATAASNNPLLTTLVAAVTSVDGLADTLNGAEALTVFAPANSAFAEIPEKDLNGLVAGAKEQGQESPLYSILAHHVVGANNDKDAIVGEQDTLAGDTLTIAGDAESGMTVSDGTVTANVVCGNVPTANATVYVIDKVMTGVK